VRGCVCLEVRLRTDARWRLCMRGAVCVFTTNAHNPQRTLLMIVVSTAIFPPLKGFNGARPKDDAAIVADTFIEGLHELGRHGGWVGGLGG
jgi:hypothetical protein